MTFLFLTNLMLYFIFPLSDPYGPLQTHLMAGNLWMWTGIATFPSGCFLPVVTGGFVLIFIGGILAALPYSYSFHLYHADKGDNEEKTTKVKRG